MKNDLITAIITTIISAVAAYFICGMFLPGLSDVTFPVLEGTIDYTLIQPNDEVFNYRAINPTVEVYVGDCTEYGEDGECLDDVNDVEDNAADELEEIVEDTEKTENTKDTENNNSSEANNGTTD